MLSERLMQFNIKSHRGPILFGVKQMQVHGCVCVSICIFSQLVHGVLTSLRSRVCVTSFASLYSEIPCVVTDTAFFTGENLQNVSLLNPIQICLRIDHNSVLSWERGKSPLLLDSQFLCYEHEQEIQLKVTTFG